MYNYYNDVLGNVQCLVNGSSNYQFQTRTDWIGGNIISHPGSPVSCRESSWLYKSNNSNSCISKYYYIKY